MYTSSNFIFKIDNKTLPIRDGVACFSQVENIKGLKKIKVFASLKNPATGEIFAENGEFQYQVLPKCSKNCQ